MFGRLVQKEFLHHLLDLRFVVVFAFCILLSGLGTYVGIRNYLLQRAQYQTVAGKNRETVENMREKGATFDLAGYGYRWNRRPEALSPLVYGLSGALGQEVLIQYRRYPRFEASSFATDPVHALFGVLDLAFVVKVVLSLSMLLFTYDAVCGEKEAGTLRLYASFPVPRSMLALAKLVGSTVAVLAPFAVAFLLVCLVLALSPELGLGGDDWKRVAVLMGVFSLYLTVFAAFGLFVSALTHRRITAFLGLLGGWVVWLYVVPNLAVDAAQHFASAGSVYDTDRQVSELREEIRKARQAEEVAYWEKHRVEDWDGLPKAQQTTLLAGAATVHVKWDKTFYARLRDLQQEWRNRAQREQRLAMLLSSVSPLGAVSFMSMDLARTGPFQQEEVEAALSVYLTYMSRYVQEQSARHWDDRAFTDFASFVYRSHETLEACLRRNVFHVLNLALLAVLGFAGAYVAILRYDVR